MDDSIGLADVGEELVSESFTFAGTLHETGDIDYLDGGGDDTSFGVTEFAEFDEPLVRDGDDTHIGFDGTERKVGTLRLGITQAVEKVTFADIRQPYYSTLQGHDLYVLFVH